MRATLNIDLSEKLRKGDTVDGNYARRLIKAGVADEGPPFRITMPAAEAAAAFDGDQNGSPGGSTAPDPSEDLAAARAEYREKFGKMYFAGWDAAELRRRIAEAD